MYFQKRGVLGTASCLACGNPSSPVSIFFFFPWSRGCYLDGVFGGYHLILNFFFFTKKTSVLTVTWKGLKWSPSYSVSRLKCFGWAIKPSWFCSIFTVILIAYRISFAPPLSGMILHEVFNLLEQVSCPTCWMLNF